MPRKMKNKLPDLRLESIGKNIAHFRKKIGLTQKDLANRIGIERTLVSDYEIGRLHLNDEMIIRFSIALGISSDELLGLKSNAQKIDYDPDLKITKRIKSIAQLPPEQKKSLLNTIDAYLKANNVKNKTDTP